MNLPFCFVFSYNIFNIVCSIHRLLQLNYFKVLYNLIQFLDNTKLVKLDHVFHYLDIDNENNLKTIRSKF